MNIVSNRQIINSIYTELVNRFSIGKCFLPKYGKRKQDISWLDFIEAAMHLEIEGLVTYTGYSSSDSLTRGTKKLYPELLKDKGNRLWFDYFYSLINLKVCSHCNLVLEYSKFRKDSYTKDGLSTYCISCYKEYAKDYQQENKEVIMEYHKWYYQENKHLFEAKTAKRRASKLQAFPAWANQEEIKRIYKERPKGYHVDHIVPLQSDLVCGLHCEFNLQYLSAEENLSKGNKFKI